MQELHSIPSVACGSCRVSLSRPLGRGCCSLCPGRYIRACVMLRFVPAIELARKGPCLPSGCVVLQLGKHTVAMEHVFDTNQSSLPLPFILVLVSISVMALSTVFHSSCKFSRHLSAFSLCSSGLISALLVLSAVYLFMKVSFSPDIIFCG